MWRTRPPSWRPRIFGKVLSPPKGLAPALRRAFFVLALLLTASASEAFAQTAPSVKAVRIDSFDAGAHIVMELDQPMTPRVSITSNPSRLIIDMPEVIWGLPQASGPVDSPVIRSFDYAPHMPGFSRLALELAEPAQLLGYDLRPAPGGRAHYLDIALATPNRRAAPPTLAGPPSAPPARVGAPRPPEAPAEEPPPPPSPPAADPSAAAPAGSAEAARQAALAAAESAQAAQRLIEEGMSRLAEERRLLAEQRQIDERRLAEQRQRILQEEIARFAAIQAAEEARLSRLRESSGPNLLQPQVAALPPPSAPLLAPTPAQPAPSAPAATPVQAQPPGPLATPRRAETAVRKANNEPHSPRLKGRPGEARPAAAAPYAPAIGDVSGLNALFDRAETARPAAAPPPPPPAPPARKTLVMLDPGHGGKDPGATRNGVKEKDVVLDYARLLRDKLVATGRYEVHMTRNGDRFVELEDRVESARVVNADILISIHADALDAKDVSGATAYLISEQGSNERLEQIIQNKDAAGSVGGVILAREDIDVARTLIDLARRTTRSLSKAFADEIMIEFAKVGPVVNRAVRPANYVVLRAPDTPAVLVELGFMSNDADLKRLQSTEWREKAADAMVKALDSWRRKR